MSAEPKAQAAAASAPERRVLRWLLVGQVLVALILVGLDLAPSLPRLLDPSVAPTLDAPVRPGDQTRRYRPGDPARPGPGLDPDMPRRLQIEEATTDDRAALRLRGAIAPGDGARVVARLRDPRAEVLLLDSPGGSVADALEIGRAVRAAGLDAHLAPGAVCLSACPYAFAGGVARSVADGARLGVHQHSHGERTLLPAFLAVDDIQRGQAEVLSHLSDMGIDLRIMGPAMATPADEIYILTPAELADWNVVTQAAR